MRVIEASQPANREGIVGRTAETGQLNASAEKAVAGSPQLVRVEGEAGIGKTYLVKHFLAGLDNFQVLVASGDPGESTLNYGLIDQLLSRVDRQLIRTFKLLDRSRPQTAIPFAIGTELLDLISTLQADRPLAIVVDDAQWTDRSSAQALGFELRRLWADQVLTVLIVRTPIVEDEPNVVDQYLSRPTIESATIHLHGLTTQDIVALSATSATGSRLPLPAAARLRDHTGGNPLYVRALLAETTPRDLIATGKSLPVPQSLAAALGRILHQLPDPTRRLVEALAVLNTRCSLARVAQLASVDNPNEALAPALEVGIVQWWPNEAANPVAMRHSLHRDAVYEALDPVRRAELHATAAHLVDSGTAWAHRVAAAQTTDGPLARKLELAAAEATGSGTHDVAARYLYWAAELSESRDDYEPRLLTACVQSLLTSLPGWAVSIQPEMRRCSDTPLRDCALGLTALLGTGELPVAEERLLRAAAGTRVPDWITSTASGALAALHVWSGRDEEALRAASIALSTGALHARMEDFVRMIRAVARSRLDGMSAGLAELDYLPALGSAVSREDVEGLACRGSLHVMLGHYGSGVDDLTNAIVHQRAGASTLFGPTPHSYLAAAQHALGNWNDAAITVHQALSIQSTFEQPQTYTLTHMAATLVPAGRGDWQVASGHVTAARRWAVKIGTPQDVRYAAIAGAVLAQARGDHAEMANSLRPLLATDQDTADSTHTWWLTWWRPLAVEALIGVGDLDAAEQQLLRLQNATRDTEHFEDTLSRLQAALAREHGNLDDALAIYRRRLESGDQPVLPFARAMLEHEFGLLLSATGNRREAVRWLRRARDRYGLLSAHPFIRRVDHSLGISNVRQTKKRSARHLPDLTEREEQVCHLVCRELTNSEIAKELYVTSKTVEYHLSNVYAKLGIASRLELRKTWNPGRAD
ncbi:helix-turn-helix transcriptional regulator [Amycolatopsis sp. H20-H5]|uniref:helix-turn-helix transcriptional regulator n=1 Tax=Amycolatopsis sp. H20-H5 TaxID=3046309 RepID=UPI002DB70F51|nr:AAA family ATPase [Amycolatopsis sp. H20-H5]MEC3978753.1 AAA family ATPase [Amycolatopsis sp. H20-H5]